MDGWLEIKECMNVLVCVKVAMSTSPLKEAAHTEAALFWLAWCVIVHFIVASCFRTRGPQKRRLWRTGAWRSLARSWALRWKKVDYASWVLGAPDCSKIYRHAHVLVAALA